MQLAFALAAFDISLVGRPLTAEAAPNDAILGRWDITITTPERTMPSWLEVRAPGNGYLVGQFDYEFGSARPVARVEFADGVLRFAIPPQWEQGKADMVVEGRVQDSGLNLARIAATDQLVAGREVLPNGIGDVRDRLLFRGALRPAAGQARGRRRCSLPRHVATQSCISLEPPILNLSRIRIAA